MAKKKKAPVGRPPGKTRAGGSISLPLEMWDKIDELAEEEELSRSKMIEYLINSGFDGR